jgi:hypothetical protein
MADEETNNATVEETPVETTAEVTTNTGNEPEPSTQTAVDDQWDIVEPDDDDDLIPPSQEGDDSADEADSGESQKQDKASEEKPVESTGLGDADKQRAQQFGFTDQEVARFKSVDELDMAIGVLARREQARLVSAQQQADQQVTSQPQQPVQQHAVQGPLPEALDLRFSPEVADEVVEPLKAVANGYSQIAAQVNQLSQIPAYVQQMEQVVGQLAQELNYRIFELNAERFDNFISGLGDDWQDTFGQGSISSLDQNSEQFKNRMRILTAAQTLDTAGRATGLNRSPSRSLWERGFRVEFGDAQTKKAVEAEKKKLANGLKKQANRITHRPTASRGRDDMPQGEERAVRNLQAKFGHMFQEE